MVKKRISITKKYINDVVKNPVKYANETEINDIVKFLKHCSDVYYNSGEEAVSDTVFDTVKDILAERDPDNYFLSQVGAPVDSKDKVDLPYPMASLDKIKPYDPKIDRWFDKYKGPYAISDKLDGVSAQLYKDKKGKVKLYTRGDAVQGRDISHLINKITSKAAIKKLPNNTSLRGEIIIPRSKHKYIKDYANGRAAVSGLTGADDGDYDEVVAKHTDLVIYSMIYPDDKDHNERMKMIKKYGFKVVWQDVVDDIDSFDPIGYEGIEESESKSDSDDESGEDSEESASESDSESSDDEDEGVSDVEMYLKRTVKARRRHSEYDVDGIVCVDSGRSYGVKSTNPKHAFAFKMRFGDQERHTTVVNIEWEPTMYAYIQPTVIVKKVTIGGSQIERATGHNAKYIHDQKIGKGAKIVIVKSGDVIPYIAEVTKGAKKPLMPKIDYKWHEGGFEIIATNIKPETAQKIGIKRTHHFFTKLNIKYISTGIITKLYDEGYNSIFKILGADHDALAEIDGIGDKLVKKIFDEIEKRIAGAKLHSIMAASLQFGRGLGLRKLKLVTDAHPDIMKLKIKKQDLIDNLNDIDGFSDISSIQFADGLKRFKMFYRRLSKCVDIKHITNPPKKKKKRKTKGVDLTGEKVVFTGFRDKVLEEKITDLGGKVTTSVSSNTTILVYVETSKGKSQKVKKAEELYDKNGTPAVMTKDSFTKKYKLE